jgi:hypothetical protein
VFSFDFYRKEARFGEKEITSVSGNGFEVDIDWAFPTNRELMDWLHEHQEQRWVAFFTDQTGLSYLAGSMDQGLKLVYARSADYSSYTKINMSGVTWHPILYIKNINIIAMLGTTIIDLREYVVADILVYAGDTISESLKFRDAMGTLENLTGSTFKMDVKDSAGTVVVAFEMGSGLSLINGNTELLLSKPGITITGEYDYDLQRTYPDGSVKTKMGGKFIIERQITN